MGKVAGEVQWNKRVAKTGKVLNRSFFRSEVGQEAGKEQG